MCRAKDRETIMVKTVTAAGFKKLRDIFMWVCICVCRCMHTCVFMHVHMCSCMCVLCMHVRAWV